MSVDVACAACPDSAGLRIGALEAQMRDDARRTDERLGRIEERLRLSEERIESVHEISSQTLGILQERERRAGTLGRLCQLAIERSTAAETLERLPAVLRWVVLLVIAVGIAAGTVAYGELGELLGQWMGQ